jgi:GntR family transcriptional repressor for pyruvate dehydrogenase complex
MIKATTEMMSKMPNSKSNSRIDHASQTLTKYIMNKKVVAGDFLPSEHELCKQMGVSRSTLREAVSILESKGMVKRLHGQGVQIVNESHRATTDMLQLLVKRNGLTIQELIEVRNIIEVQAAELAAERATATDRQLIKNALQIMQSENVTLAEYAKADIEFHVAVAQATHNSVLVLIIETIRPLLHDVILATLKSNSRPEQSLHYHEKIFSAIESGDRKKASRAMTEHLEGTKGMLLMK